jgi:hypothetical protein
MAYEKSLERTARRNTRDAGGWLIKLLPWVDTGLPDRMALLPVGRVVFVEFKRPGGEGKVSPKQKLWKARIQKLGFEHYVIDDIEEFNSVVLRRSPKKKARYG